VENVNKRNIDALHNALKDEIKCRESSDDNVRQLRDSVIMLQGEIDSMRQLIMSIINRR